MLPKNSISRTYLLTKAWKAQTQEEKRRGQSAEKNRLVEKKIQAAAAAKRKAAERADAAVRRSGARTLAEKEAVRRRYLEKAERTTPMVDYDKLVREPIGNHGLSSSDLAQNAAVTSAFEVTSGVRYEREIAEASNRNRIHGRVKGQQQCKRWSNTYFDECDDYDLVY